MSRYNFDLPTADVGLLQEVPTMQEYAKRLCRAAQSSYESQQRSAIVEVNRLRLQKRIQSQSKSIGGRRLSRLPTCVVSDVESQTTVSIDPLAQGVMDGMFSSPMSVFCDPVVCRKQCLVPESKPVDKAVDNDDMVMTEFVWELSLPKIDSFADSESFCFLGLQWRLTINCSFSNHSNPKYLLSVFSTTASSMVLNSERFRVIVQIHCDLRPGELLILRDASRKTDYGIQYQFETAIGKAGLMSYQNRNGKMTIVTKVWYFLSVEEAKSEKKPDGNMTTSRKSPSVLKKTITFAVPRPSDGQDKAECLPRSQKDLVDGRNPSDLSSNSTGNLGVDSMTTAVSKVGISQHSLEKHPLGLELHEVSVFADSFDETYSPAMRCSDAKATINVVPTIVIPTQQLESAKPTRNRFQHSLGRTCLNSK